MAATQSIYLTTSTDRAMTGSVQFYAIHHKTPRSPKSAFRGSRVC